MRLKWVGLSATVALGSLLVLMSGPPALGSGVSPIPKFSGNGWAREVQLGADGRGRATAVWQSGTDVIRTSTFDGTRWTCPVTLPDSRAPLVYAGGAWDLDVAPNGNAVFGATIKNQGVALWTRSGPRGKWVKVTWTTPQATSVVDESAPPTVALTGGVALVAWSAGLPGTGTLGVYGARIPVGSSGPIAVTPMLLGEGVTGQDPDVAVDATGNGYLQILNGDSEGSWLEQLIWPSGGTPRVVRRVPTVDGQDSSTSAHANASGQLIAMWVQTPGENVVSVKVATGTVTTGVTSEGIWTSNEENLGTHALASDIATNGSVALMSIDQEGLISTGVGSVAGGAASMVPTWSGGAPVGRALTDQWEVTTSNTQAWVAYNNDSDTAFLARITPGGLVTAVQQSDMLLLSAAVVSVGGRSTGAMMGENTSGPASHLLTTLPTQVGVANRKCG